MKYANREFEVRKLNDGTYSAWVKDGDTWQCAQGGMHTFRGAAKAGMYGCIVMNAFDRGERIPPYLEVYDEIHREFQSIGEGEA